MPCLIRLGEPSSVRMAALGATADAGPARPLRGQTRARHAGYIAGQITVTIGWWLDPGCPPVPLPPVLQSKRDSDPCARRSRTNWSASEKSAITADNGTGLSAMTRYHSLAVRARRRPRSQPRPPRRRAQPHGDLPAHPRILPVAKSAFGSPAQAGTVALVFPPSLSPRSLAKGGQLDLTSKMTALVWSTCTSGGVKMAMNKRSWLRPASLSGDIEWTRLPLRLRTGRDPRRTVVDKKRHHSWLVLSRFSLLCSLL
jgi:hypothetical protein